MARYATSHHVSHLELTACTGREPENLRDLLMGYKPASLQEKARIRALVCHVVSKLERELDPYGGMKHLMIRRGPAHAGEITEFYAMTGEIDDG